MKRYLLIVVLLFIGWGSYGQGWEWADEAKGAGSGYGFNCSTDGLGNIYHSGHIWGTLQYGSYTFAPNAHQWRRALITKHDCKGNLIWAKSNTIGDGSSHALTTDAYNNVYLLGGTDSSFNLDGVTISNPPLPGGSYGQYGFITKIDAAGNVKWIKTIGNVLGGAYAGGYKCMTTDAKGNIYLTLAFYNDPIIGSFHFVNTDTSHKTSDILVCKFDSSGNIVWGKSFGGERYDGATGIAVTQSGKIYIGGVFSSSTLKFGSTTLVDTGFSHFYTSVFVAQLDNVGNPIWASSAGGFDNMIATYGLAVDSKGNVIMPGCYRYGAIKFGTYTLTTALSWTYGFLVKYDTLGNVIWAKGMRGHNNQGYGVAVDPCDNIWISMSSCTDIDTLDDHEILLPPCNNPCHLVLGEWHSSGTFIRATSLCVGLRGGGLAIDSFQNLYVGSAYDFPLNPSKIDTVIVVDDTIVNSLRTTNMYVAKFSTGDSCASTKTEGTGGCSGPYKSGFNNQEIASSDFSLYPNPANTECTITYNGLLSTHAGIAIYDLTGRLMHTYPLTGSSTTISIAHLPPGMYVCKIDADGHGVVSRKLVVMR